MEEISKEDILARSRAEGKDEMEQDVLKGASKFGTIALIVMCALFTLVRMLRGEKTPPTEFLAILFAYESAVFIYKYIRLKKRHELVAACFYAVFGMFLTVWYFIYKIV